MGLPDLHLLPGVPLPVLRGDPHPCPYLPGKTATNVYAVPLNIDSQLYGRLMDCGFRRSGPAFYRPVCADCDACRPIRVRVADFQPSRSQRRVWRRNQDVRVECTRPSADDEHWEIYRRYQAVVHDGKMLGTRAEFGDFFAGSPIATFEMQYRVDGRLIGVGVLDLCPDVLSSVYFYYDPAEARRSLGVYSSLCELQRCRELGLASWYIGYWVAGCPKMAYKAEFRPCELLGADRVWRAMDGCAGVSGGGG